MALSFGFDNKILSSSMYNLCYSLPFMCAFYVVNNQTIYSVPLFGELSVELSSLLNIFAVAFYYFIFVFYVVVSANLSQMVRANKLTLIPVAIIFIMMLYKIFQPEPNQPKIIFIFCLHAFLVLAAYPLKRGAVNISLATTLILGPVLSLICFTTGVLWYFETFLFSDYIASLMGLATIDPNSYKLGAVMLFSMGYVIFYGTYKLNEVTETFS